MVLPLEKFCWIWFVNTDSWKALLNKSGDANAAAELARDSQVSKEAMAQLFLDTPERRHAALIERRKGRRAPSL